MILQRLCEYYDRLADDPTSGIPKNGWIIQGIAFEVVIDDPGDLVSINDLRESDGKKTKNRLMTLPGTAKPSGSGLNPSIYGWERTDYMLGYIDPDSLSEEERAKKIARTKAAHQAYKNAMLEREQEVGHQAYAAWCRFLDKWDPGQAEHHPLLKEVSGLFGVIRLRNQYSYLHEVPSILSQGHQSSQESRNLCIVSGTSDVIAKTHKIQIKGVDGAQSSGALLVSFNRPAFESHGHEQGSNAPVGEDAAFKYTTALNHLLARDGHHRLKIGDTTTVFWAERPSCIATCDAEELFLFGLQGFDEKTEDTARIKQLQTALKHLQDGRASTIEAGTRFYVLGLSPNASRLSVRFWHESTIADVLGRVAKHQSDLDITHSSRDRDHLPLWLLLSQTARESKDTPPLLGGALMRAVLHGTPYPNALLQAVMRRIRADRLITHPRSAIIKAILTRNHRKEIPVMLDENRSETAYQLGRLFAALEKAQEDALPGLNATIKDRYFSAASATPGTVFPRLIRGSQHHLHKLDGGSKVHAEKRIQAVVQRIDHFPMHLDLVGQGLFALGYYHQRHAFFTKKSESDSSAA